MSKAALFLVDVAPTLTIVILSVCGVFVLVAIWSGLRKLHKQLLRQAIADCIVENGRYQNFESVDELARQLMQAEKNSKNISDDFIEGAYLLFLTQKHARWKMKAILERAGNKVQQFPPAVKEWRSRGLDADESRLIGRIGKYRSRYKRIVLMAFRDRIEKFRRKSIEGFSEIFVSMKDFIHDESAKGVNDLVLQAVRPPKFQ